MLLLTLLLASATATAAGPSRTIFDPAATPDWTAQVNGSGASLDSATAAVAASSGVYVGGWAGNAAGNWDATLAKFSTSGARQWLKRYNGPAHNLDLLWAIAKGPNGTIYGAGTTQTGKRKLDMLVIKWSAGGTRLWVRTYDGPAHNDDVAVALGVDRSGNVTVAGSSRGSNGLDYVVVRWSSAGVRKSLAGRSAWRYDGSAHADDAATDVVVESGGTTYVTGNTVTTGLKDATLTVKFTAAGARSWQKVSRGPAGLGAGANALCPRPGGGVYVAGWNRASMGDTDAMMLRYTGTGSAKVLQQMTSLDDEMLADVAVTTNRRVIGVGRGWTNVPIAFVWTSETTVGPDYSVGGPFDDAFTAVATDAYGGFYATGYQGTAPGQAQLLTFRHSLVASELSGFRSFWGPALALDVPGDVVAIGTRAYVVGTTGHATQGSNQVVLCYVW